METRIATTIEKLAEAIQQAFVTGDPYQFQDPAYDLMDEIAACDKPFDALRPIFALIENAPEIDFGGPGPLGSFLEDFYQKGYEEELLASIKRNPTAYTIFLLFRIIADEQNPNIAAYKTLLKTFENASWLAPFWQDEIKKL